MTPQLGISYIWMQLVYNEHPNVGYVEGNWVVAKSVFRFYYVSDSHQGCYSAPSL